MQILALCQIRLLGLQHQVEESERPHDGYDIKLLQKRCLCALQDSVAAELALAAAQESFWQTGQADQC